MMTSATIVQKHSHISLLIFCYGSNCFRTTLAFRAGCFHINLVWKKLKGERTKHLFSELHNDAISWLTLKFRYLLHLC